jgi:3-hydroxyacyl-CoA dehydrogenase
MSKVAIIGIGLVGRAWAIIFARAGHAVTLWDEDDAAPARALGFIDQILPELARHDLLLGGTPESVRANLIVTPHLASALADSVHVQESTPERLDVKQAIFRRLDEASPPRAVIASSSSAILPSLFTEKLPGRARCLVVHPLNPPYLIPAAEIVPAPWTSPQTVAQTRDLLVAAGMKPIVMKREIDGFIMNRLQGALLEEAFRLVADGYASVEDVDIGIRDGLALRWSFMGPFETIDLNAPGGVEDYVARYQPIYANLFSQMQRRVDWGGDVLATVTRERRERLPVSGLAHRQTWRDKQLMALAAHKRRAAKAIGE